MHYYCCNSTPLFQIIGRSSRQKTSKDIADLNSTINQFDLIDSYIIHLTTTVIILLSNLHGTLAKTEHIFGLKIYNNRFKTRNHSEYVLDYNEIKLKINNKKRAGKYPNVGSSNITLLNNPCSNREVSRD